MTEKIPPYDPARLNEQKPTPASEDPHADIADLHTEGDLMSVIRESTGVRRARAVTRLKNILDQSIEALAGGIAGTNDSSWKTSLQEQKEAAEARLRALKEEN